MFTGKGGTHVSTESKLTNPPNLNLLTNQRGVYTWCGRKVMRLIFF